MPNQILRTSRPGKGDVIRALLAVLLLCLPTAASLPLDQALEAFAARYNAFITEMNAGKYDVKQARGLSDSWHRVEASGEWPK